jgi:uncharacterized protein YqgC (DUF456 family)
MDVWTVLLFIGTLLIMLIGLAGVILPVIPGVPIIWLGAFLYGLFTGFEEINWNILGIFAILTGFTIVLDYVANLYGAKRMGATRWGILGALFGMLVGLFTGGLIGLLIGSFVGAVLGEILSGKTQCQALKAGIGTFLGFLGGTLIKLIVGCIMIGVFLWKVLF